MADQKDGPQKGLVFIPPPTAGQIEAAKHGPARTIKIQISPPKPKAETSAGDSPAHKPAETQRSLKKTLFGLPAVAPPAHREEKMDSAALWASAGLVPKKKGEKREGPPQVEEVFDRLMEFRRRIDFGDVEMANFVMLQMEGEFRSLMASERLQPICSGGRAFLDAEKPVAESIGKIRDEVYRKFGEDRRLRPFLKDFVDTVLSSAPIRESERKTETEMRNGFYRAVAWCLCAHNSQDQLVSYLSKNRLSLIDGVGIATGLSTADSIQQAFSRDMIAILLERKWVSLAFYHLQEMMKTDLMRLSKIEKSGGDAEGARDRLYANMDTFLLVFFREVENYQTLAQKYTHLAMLLGNLTKDTLKDASVMYLAPSQLYSLVTTRQMPVTKVWEDLGRTHKFIAEKMVDREEGRKQYVVGLRPRDIAQRFFTILEAVDFLTSDPRIKELALKMIRDLHAPFSQDPERNEAFKKVVSMALFTEKEDLERHSALFRSFENHTDPIISLRASEHREMLLSRKNAPAKVSIDPFELADADDDSPL